MHLTRSAVVLLASIVGGGIAQSTDYSDLVGTWTTKSNSTITGPGFYDPIADQFIEPAHTGISYSFTDDGFYESAYFRAISDPTNPQCASAMLQFQHGSFEKQPNGSLTLTPIAIDGRQLESAPCKSKKAIYSRFNQSELHRRYAQYIDAYHQVPRLDLFQHDGAPLPAMYLVSKTPQMLPTTTLHPPASSATARGTRAMMKRRLYAMVLPQGHNGVVDVVDADTLWWTGLGLVGMGSVLYWCF